MISTRAIYYRCIEIFVKGKADRHIRFRPTWVQILVFVLIFTISIGCRGKEVDNHEIDPPQKPLQESIQTAAKSDTVSIKLPSLCLDKFDTAMSLTLRRYFSGNPRWEVRQERGKIYAIRKEQENGKYETSLNGFYTNDENGLGLFQTRVIVSFGKYYGFGNDESVITFAKWNDEETLVKLQAEHPGSPGNSSYLIISGGDVHIEIYEQAQGIAREFTQQTIAELDAELRDVLKFRKQIERDGVMPAPQYYPSSINGPYFRIADGMQPGIYVVSAGLQLNQAGIVYVKVFDVKTGESLSADRMTPRTTREVGWSSSGKTVFPYESELTVYEGDWEHKFEARFEIWFKGNDGTERKLDQKTQLINGWEF